MSLPLSEASDAELAVLALGNRQAAFRELLARHREPVFRFVRANVGDSDEALDVTQEVFVSAFAALKRYDTARPFAAWLRRIALNKCRDWARRRRVRSFFTRAAPLEEAFAVRDESPPVDVQAADRVELGRIAAAIALLPTRQREVLVLRTVEALSQAEAAELLGVSEKTIETRLYRARTRLRKILGHRDEG